MSNNAASRPKVTFDQLLCIIAVTVFAFTVYISSHSNDENALRTATERVVVNSNNIAANTIVDERLELQKSIPVPIPVVKMKNHPDKPAQRKYRPANTAVRSHMSWEEFVKLPLTENESLKRGLSKKRKPLQPDYEPILCSPEVVNKLSVPMLGQADVEWCKWAISSTGGGVIVGKSWGNLKREDQLKFDVLNCNAVNAGKNPSCDDSWGDIHISNWRKNALPQYNCDADKPSKIHCSANENADKYCILENMQFDFSKMRKYERGDGQSPSKHFDAGFLSTECSASPKAPDGFPFSHLYTPQVSKKQCDYVHNGTLLVFSHDDLRNVGHTLNDIMNVWVMMWMDGLARDSHSLNLLNIDSFKLGHNWDDQPNAFFLPYKRNMHSILKGIDFNRDTLCVQRLILQPLPPKFFVWESWVKDQPCSFIGPSTLFQRWNFHVRHSYKLLLPQAQMLANKRFQVLLIVRNVKTNLWGASQTSRNFLNVDAIQASLNTTMRQLESVTGPNVLIVKDLSTLEMYEQVKLISESSILVGMHGAGMASSMHMSIGTKHCCGALEIYPFGEHTPIRGHGNMARKMGIHYDRVDIRAEDSRSEGAVVPVQELSKTLINMVQGLQAKPTCVMPAVVSDPYLESVL